MCTQSGPAVAVAEAHANVKPTDRLQTKPAKEPPVTLGAALVASTPLTLRLWSS